MKRLLAWCTGFALVAAQTLPASSECQDPAQPTLRVSVSTILVDVVVRDQQGRPVPGLGVEDFVVEQDGRPQKITLLDYVSGEPDGAAEPVSVAAAIVPEARRQGRTLVIVWDDLALGHETTYFAKQALLEFIDRHVKPHDSVAFVRTSTGTSAAQRLTGDKAVLRDIVSGVRSKMLSPGEGNTFTDRTLPGGRMSAVPESVLSGGYEAAPPKEPTRDEAANRATDKLLNEAFAAGLLNTLSTVIDGLSTLPGRKGVLVVSEGFALREGQHVDRLLLDGLRGIARRANNAQVVLYVVNAGRFNSFVAGRSPLLESPYDSKAQGPSLLATETGGYFFKNPSDLGLVMARSADDLRGYYLLGYTLDDETLAAERRRPEFHQLKVRVKRSNVNVRSRKGFFGVPTPRRSPADAEDPLVAAALSPFGSDALPVRMTSVYLHPDGTRPSIRSMLQIDGAGLSFVATDKGSAANVDAIAVAVDSKGKIVGQDWQRYVIQRAPDAADDDFVYRIDVPVEKPGPYYLRVAVRDRTSMRIGAASQFVLVPDLSRGRLALSGVMMGADDASRGGHPAVRRFSVPANLSYSVQVLNARSDPGGKRALRASVRLIQDGAVRYAGPMQDVQTDAPPGTLALVSGALSLGEQTAPGDYSLWLTVTDTLAPKEHATASSAIDFTIEPHPRFDDDD
jgi:VWFA-related protein